jgi:hypothetical protein
MNFVNDLLCRAVGWFCDAVATVTGVSAVLPEADMRTNPSGRFQY